MEQSNNGTIKQFSLLPIACNNEKLKQNPPDFSKCATLIIFVEINPRD
jgi:hypothetical protein